MAGRKRQYDRTCWPVDALAAAMHCRSGSRLVCWLQVDCTNAATGVGATARGAIAYDPAGLTAVLTTGVDNSNSDQLRRTTAQAILGLPRSDSYSAMSAAGSSASVPSLTCTQPRTATAKPNGYRHHLRRIAQIGDGRHFCQRRASVLFRVKKGSAGSWGMEHCRGWVVLVPASKTARYVEVIARDGGNDSPAVTVPVRARNSSASRRGCQAFALSRSPRLLPSAPPRPRRLAQRPALRGGSMARAKWKTVGRVPPVNFAVKSAVGVNWEFRTGRRTVAISVRAPR